LKNLCALVALVIVGPPGSGGQDKPRKPAEITGDSALPEGNTGIASRFPDDDGIENDAAVLFHDDFEDAAAPADLARKWDAAVHHERQIRIADEADAVHSGKRALEFAVPKQAEELSNTVAKRLREERDILFLRYYSKFEKGFDQVGSSHNGATISAHYHVEGRATPGVKADGRNKFLISFENWRGEAGTTSPGDLNIYCYHPEQRDRFGDHFFPSGKVLPFSVERSGAATFGKGFIARPDIIPERDRWYCFEVMLKANTVGKRDGRIACWLDGKLIADFSNLRFRDVETLKIDRFSLDLHIGSNTIRANTKRYDDVVAAASYIGPMVAKKKPAKK
jgi:hypothetical protein